MTIDVDITIRLTLPAEFDASTWPVRKALENLADVMLVQVGDGLYFAGSRDAEGVDNLLVCEIERSTIHSIEPVVVTGTGTCRHCDREIRQEDGRWVDPEAAGDDSVWRETCDSHDTFTAEHEPLPAPEHPHDHGYYEEN